MSCTTRNTVHDIGNSITHHASLLKIKDLGNNCWLCQVTNPFEAETQYLLVPAELSFDEQQARHTYGEFTLLRTPLTNNALTASCHGYLLEQLGALTSIGAFCDAEYVTYRPVKEAIAEGKIANGGSSSMPNIETILAHSSNAIWISPFENATTTSLDALHMPVVSCADYLEISPLARAEWMKFYGRLVGKASQADSLFAVVETRYNALKHSVSANNSSKPIVLAETPYGATWYVAGGQSTMGIMYADAGYDYPWANDTHSGSIALSPETVLNEAQQADIWFVKYFATTNLTLQEFLAQNSFFGEFKAAQQGNVYGCNTSASDYFDATPFRPDILLDALKKPGSCYFEKLH